MEACNLLQGPEGIVGSREWKRHRGRVTGRRGGSRSERKRGHDLQCTDSRTDIGFLQANVE
jgi:hypothetical protein